MANTAVKNQFKVPEGRYVLHSEKTVGLVPFVMRRTTRLTIAALHGGEEEGMYMVYNVGDYLHVCPFDATEKVCSSSNSIGIGLNEISSESLRNCFMTDSSLLSSSFCSCFCL